MRHILDEYIKKFIVKHNRATKILTALFVLAISVTLGVFLRLRLVGISMTYDANLPGNITQTFDTLDNIPSPTNEDFGANKGFILNLFDYDAVDNIAGGTDYSLYNASLRNKLINDGHVLNFLPQGANYGNNNFPETNVGENAIISPDHYANGAIAVQGIVDNLLDVSEEGRFPRLSALADSKGTREERESLKYLFSAGAPYVHAYSNLTGLFRREGNWIYYNSDENYAFLNQATGQFGVNGTTFGVNDDVHKAGFFPFNEYNNTKNNVNPPVYDVQDNDEDGIPDDAPADLTSAYNHHFGLSMSASFTLYEGAKINGDDMQFLFKGDDDMWVFIDGVLVLDIGGIHDPVSGYINFAERDANGNPVGKVYVEDATTVGSKPNLDASGTPIEHGEFVATIDEMFARAGQVFNHDAFSTHKIDVFYMERGGVYSNLMIKTNIFERQILDVVKVWDDGGLNHSEDSVKYHLNKVYLDDNKVPTGAKDLVHEGTLSPANKWHERVERVDIPDGKFEYEVVEVDVPSGYYFTVDISEESKIEVDSSGADSGSNPPATPTVTPARWDTDNTLVNGATYLLSSWISEEEGERIIVGSVADGATWSNTGTARVNAVSTDLNNVSSAALWDCIDGRLQNRARMEAGLPSYMAYSDNTWGYGTYDEAAVFQITLPDGATNMYVLSPQGMGTQAGLKMNGNTGYSNWIRLSRYVPASNAVTTGNWQALNASNYQNLKGGDYFVLIRNGNDLIEYKDADQLWGYEGSNSVYSLPKDSTQFLWKSIWKYYDNGQIQNMERARLGLPSFVRQFLGDNNTLTWEYSTSAQASYFNITPIENQQNYFAVENKNRTGYEGSMKHAMNSPDHWMGIRRFVPDTPDDGNNSGNNNQNDFNITVIPGQTYVITNTLIKDGEIVVQKEWKDLISDIEAPDLVDVPIELVQYRYNLGDDGNIVGNPVDSKVFDTRTLTATSNYKDTFINLPPVQVENGVVTHGYRYSVREVGATDNVFTYDGKNYNVTYSASKITKGQIVITNKMDGVSDLYEDVVATKQWLDGNKQPMAAPMPITVILYQQKIPLIIVDGVLQDAGVGSTAEYQRVTLGTSADSLTYTWPNLPLRKQEDDGQIYRYVYSATELESESGRVKVGQDEYFSSVIVVPSDGTINVSVTNKKRSEFYEPPGPAVVDYHKTIDALTIANSDGTSTEGNKDTTAMNTDLYRLYLDLESYASETPVDLLIVADQSGSMWEQHDISFKGEENQYRDVVLSYILNGYAYSDYSSNNEKPKPENNWGGAEFNHPTYVNATVTDDSLINQFLRLNSQNRIAVIGFDANRSDTAVKYSYTDYPYKLSDGYSYEKDSRILLNWGNTQITNPVNVGGNAYTGTNYEAALLRADEMFRMLDEQTDASENRKRVMIFFSDGVPTCYIHHSDGDGYVAGDRGGTTMSGALNDPENKNLDNIRECVEPSLNAFKTFVQNNENVTVYSVGLSGELGQNTNTGIFDSTVLSQYKNLDGTFFYAGDNGNALQKELLRLLLPATPIEAVITDELSSYVEYYKAQPDVLVTMKNKKGTGSETILWKGDKAEATFTTYDNQVRPIVKAVEYTDNTDKSKASTGMIKVIFDPEYIMTLNNVYTLSYNVKVTQDAYDYLKTDTYPHVGNAHTDYSNGQFENKTSSGQAGFKSNYDANIWYRYEGTEYITKYYEHPVVQVATTDIEVTKKWLGSDDEPLLTPYAPISVQIYQTKKEHPTSGADSGNSEMNGDWGVAKTLEAGNTYVIVNADGNALAYGSANPNSVIGFRAVDVEQEVPAEVQWDYKTDHSFSLHSNPAIHIHLQADSEWSGTWYANGESGTELYYEEDTEGGRIYAVVNSINAYLQKESAYNITPDASQAGKFVIYKYEEKQDPISPPEPSGDPEPLNGDPCRDPIVLEGSKLTQVVNDLPIMGYENGVLYDYTYYVVELDTENQPYQPTYSNDGKPVDGKVLITNTMYAAPGYELPHTGGIGTYIYYMSGAMLLALGYLFRYICKRKQEGRSDA